MAVEIDKTNRIGLRKDELRAQTLKGLGDIFSGFRKLRKKDKSLTRRVARESQACVKNFKKMAIMVKHTQRLVSEELEDLVKKRLKLEQEERTRQSRFNQF